VPTVASSLESLAEGWADRELARIDELHTQLP
jgi:hypothetical protein